MNIVGLILAQSGSKGIPNKNIKLLHGKPLIRYIIDSAKQVVDTYVSSDSQKILNLCDDVGTILRPKELAQDKSKSVDAVQHFLSLVSADYVLLMNACTPFTSEEDIKNIIKIAEETKCDSVVSLVEDFSCHPSKVCTLEDGKVVGVDKSFETAERQGLSTIFKRNTALYLAKKEVIMSGTFFGEDTRGYVMPKDRSLDLNDMYDWKIAELLYEAAQK